MQIEEIADSNNDARKNILTGNYRGSMFNQLFVSR